MYSILLLKFLLYNNIDQSILQDKPVSLAELIRSNEMVIYTFDYFIFGNIFKFSNYY